MHDRPSVDEVQMRIAHIWAERSTCQRLQVGAVLVRDGRTLASGYNGAPQGMPHCTHKCDCGHADLQYPNAHYNTCAFIAPCTNVIHAEANCIAFAARFGIPTQGSVIYTTHSPCPDCARLIVNAGIIKVYFGEWFRDAIGLDVLHTMLIPCRHIRLDEVDAPVS